MARTPPADTLAPTVPSAVAPPSRVGPPSPVDLAGLDDRTLAGRASDGDTRAFEVIVRRYAPLMRGYATRVLGGNADSDDVVQDSFIVAWEQLPHLDDGQRLRSWLMRIVTRRSIDRIRSRRIVEDIADHDVPAASFRSPDRIVEARTQEEALSRALAALPDPQRQSWVLREVAGYSYEDIAGEIDVPVSTVRGLLSRARRTLVESMEEWR